MKVDVEKGLPPKKELIVYCPLSATQNHTYGAVLKDNIEVLHTGGGGERLKLLNVVMQLRKACNHPYLFDGVEDRTLDPFGEHLVSAAGKLSFLDKLLCRLKEQGSRVLIFSQMTRMLDILEDYCTMRELEFCRIDGSTDGEERETAIEEYNKPGSTQFVFLLSTRAGGLGINLTGADVVVLYDSDWNPQVDLQAQDRAHRIGQTKPVKVYRLVCEKSIEEKILERAMKKLQLDALVIQQGKLSGSVQASKDEISAAIRFGADGILSAAEAHAVVTGGASAGGGSAAVDIDAILARAEERTSEMNKKIAQASEGQTAGWSFDGDLNEAIVAEEPDAHQGQERRGEWGGQGALHFVDIGKRARKQTKTFGSTQSHAEARVGEIVQQACAAENHVPCTGFDPANACCTVYRSGRGRRRRLQPRLWKFLGIRCRERQCVRHSTAPAPALQ